ncbi:MAG TPA: ImmA/IrrE family metallo-endopeptidase [Rhizomicrobium sp.]
MAKDYVVSPRSEESIAQLAYKLRDVRGSREEPRFNIADFVKNTLPTHLKAIKKGDLRLEFYDRDFKEDDPAFVSFNPPTLNSDKQIWVDAGAGDSYPRFVMAHEIGHLVLHDRSAKAFSQDKSDQIQFIDNEESAEWQANIFAGHFLLPDAVIQKIAQVSFIASICQVPEALALERVIAFRRVQERKNRTFAGGYCSKCGNFSLLQMNGSTLVKCTTFDCDNVVSRL